MNLTTSWVWVTTSEPSRGDRARKFHLYKHGTGELEGIAEAMFFIWEHKPEAPREWGGLVQGHPVTWRQSGLCPHILACPCPLSLSPLLRADLRAAQVSGPYRERRRHLRLVGPHSGLSTSLGSNLKGSQVLLCSRWKHSYLFIMLEKSLQDRKEMLQSTEFYFFCRFILIPCGFPQASLLFL